MRERLIEYVQAMRETHKRSPGLGIGPFSDVALEMFENALIAERTRSATAEKNGRRVVCAAIRDENGHVICGPRHFDAVMHRQLEAYGEGTWNQAEQGFIDQHGEWLSREEALHIALANGQVIRRCGGDDQELFSENLY